MKKNAILLLAMMVFATIACRKSTPVPPEPKPFTTFMVKGLEQHFPYASNFSKDFCSSSTYCCRFFNVDEATSKQLKIGIPGDPVVGHIYQTGEYRFSCFYIDDNLKRYDLATAPFMVVFTLWEGQGGWAKGNFSGWMKSAEGDSIHFENGFFQNKIWTLVP